MLIGLVVLVALREREMDGDESFGELHAVSKLADDAIRLQLADPVATATRKHMGHRAFLPPVTTTELPRARLPHQFSTRFVLLVTAVVAILSTLMRQVEPSILAGSCGVIAMAYLGILCWRAVRHPIAWAVFWLLLACYSMLAIRGTGS